MSMSFAKARDVSRYFLCLTAEELSLQTLLAETAALVEAGARSDENWFVSR